MGLVATETADEPRELPITSDDIRAAIRAAEDAIDVALDVDEMDEVRRLASWRWQLRKALRLFESGDDDGRA